ELVKILQCKQIECPRYEVQIVFYDVKPDVVRKQTDTYAEAFSKHQVSNRPEVDKWKEALSMAASFSGWDLQDMTNGFESKFIDSISIDILKTLCDGPLHVGDNLVGIDFHFEKLNLSRFVAHMKIMKTEDQKISNVGEGIMMIKQRIARKPILLVLDDVDDHEQLEALAGSATWFCPGSLIIFTGKDKQLLSSHGVHEIYEMEFLDNNKALELFSLYASGKRPLTDDFKDLAFHVVKHLQGHPLALKVIGRLLYKKSVHVWKSELDRLQTYPNSKIVRGVAKISLMGRPRLQKLRPSFDGLASDQKEMFLDIACAFIGENKYFAASVLDRSHCSANAIIEVLADKCLITVYAYCLQMHELWISSEDYDVPNVNKV
ncbi:NB-ARC domains-containing protein, partial [Tanacetum coccineum]